MRRRALIPAVGSHNRKTFSDAGLSASDFLDRIAALIPPPRKHRHCYFWVLAPNSPLWALVTAYAGRQLVAGSKAPRPNTVRVVAGATRAGKGRAICGRRCWRASTGCLRSSAAGAAGGCTWLVHHRAGDGAADTGTCRRANNCTGNRTGVLTTAGDEWTAADCSGRGV